MVRNCGGAIADSDVAIDSVRSRMSADCWATVSEGNATGSSIKGGGGCGLQLRFGRRIGSGAGGGGGGGAVKTGGGGGWTC